MNTPTRRRLLVAGLASLTLLATACGSDSKSTTTTTPTAAPSTAAPATTAASSTSAGGTATTHAPATTAAGTATTAGAGATTTAPKKVSGQLNGSGSTFVQTFVEESIADFTKGNSDLTINYGGGGSGKGRQDLADQLVDFAGTDGTIKDTDLPSYKGGAVLYFPVVVAPITVSYNLGGVDTLKLSPATIAKIFQVQITNWNDAAIAADNPGVTLPDQAITVVHRSDSSGTTSNFTKFLDSAVGSKGDGTWTLGTDSTVAWPANTQAGNGNGGVAQIIGSTKGAVGYVDYSDAVDAKLTFAQVENKAGKFVTADLDGASAAAAGATVADNLTFSAVWADGDTSYPITAQTWIIVYQKQTDATKGTAIKAFLDDMLTNGQKIAPDVNYAPLPAALATKAIAQLDKLAIG
ncbi:MAG: phosphate transporter periplasmic phosphate-binding protein [Ilumatobacteraceae bacterium]|nr:phosphate transporter periplasmic phosphate-binding protein [Ilumatobacteraceae bacterium]